MRRARIISFSTVRQASTAHPYVNDDLAPAEAGNPHQPESTALVQTRIALEVEQFNVAMPRLAGEMHRAGQGLGETKVLIREHAGLRVITVDMGFPVVGRVHNGSGLITMALALEVPTHSRWQGTDLSDGMIYLYPPGELHETIAGAGMQVGVASIEADVVAEAAEDLGRRPVRPWSGFLRPDVARHVVRAFRRSGFSEDPTALTGAMAAVLSSPETTVRPVSARQLSSGAITRRAIDYVHDTGQWSPSSLTLCRATGVSERRLQLAFADIYGMPPSRFFRLRALSMARGELVRADGSMHAPVTQIAIDLGFEHLSRFASDYRRHYGETPSATLARARRPPRTRWV